MRYEEGSVLGEQGQHTGASGTPGKPDHQRVTGWVLPALKQPKEVVVSVCFIDLLKEDTCNYRHTTLYFRVSMFLHY